MQCVTFVCLLQGSVCRLSLKSCIVRAVDTACSASFELCIVTVQAQQMLGVYTSWLSLHHLILVGHGILVQPGGLCVDLDQLHLLY